MLIFEKSVKGRTGVLLDECDVPAVALNAPRRAQEARLPEVSEIDVIRHYTALSKKAHGVDDGFYPLGSCTMKYNPRVNDAVAALSGFTRVHLCRALKTLRAASRFWTGFPTSCAKSRVWTPLRFNPQQALTANLPA